MNGKRTVQAENISRRSLLSAGIGAVGLSATAFSMLTGCGGSSSKAGPSQDTNILNAAATAEALASVMYDNIIKSALYTRLGQLNNFNDQAYLAAGREQEATHYQFLVNAGAKPLATTFYFPVGMFTTANGQQNIQTTLNTLITLEDAFIAAYLIGIRDFSSPTLRVYAGQILGVESEHRAFGRVIAADLGLSGVTGLSGQLEPVNNSAGGSSFAAAANNLAFERTFSSALPNIGAVVSALGPFVTAPTAGAANAYDGTPYAYQTTNYYLTTSPTAPLANTAP